MDDERIRVGIAEYAVTTDDTLLSTSGLGSCVGVGLYDPQAEVAGLAHIMLPYAEGGEDEPVSKYADTGIQALINELESQGAARARLVAKIAGGSSMLGGITSGNQINERNIKAVRTLLDQFGINLVNEDVGGEHGRSIELDPATGDLIVNAARGDDQIL